MADATTAETTADESGPEPYDGLPGAFPYAFRASESSLFKGYVVLAVLLSVLITLVFALGLVVLFGSTFSVRGGTFTFSRAFFFFVGLLVVAPLLAPVLSVARRHRRGGSTVMYDRAIALSALTFVASLYVGLVASVPAELQEPTTNPVVAALYGLPQIAGLVPPVVAVVVMYLVHRALR